MNLMKTTIFTAWTKLVDKFLNDIATESVTYEQLSNWIDKYGSIIFRTTQAAYFESKKEEFIRDFKQDPVKFNLTKKQLAYGFDHVIDGLLTDFPTLSNSINDKYANLKVDIFSEKFNLFISVRGATTSLVAKNNTEGLESLKFTMNAYECLDAQLNDSLELMREHLLKMQANNVTASRAPSSPLLYKQQSGVDQPPLTSVNDNKMK
jgi:hypothetical protein